MNYSIVLCSVDEESECADYRLLDCVGKISEANEYAYGFGLRGDDIIAVCDTAAVPDIKDMAEYIYFVDSSGVVRLAPQPPHHFLINRAKRMGRLGCSWLHWGNIYDIEYDSPADMIFMAAKLGVDKVILNRICDAWIGAMSKMLNIDADAIERIKDVSVDYVNYGTYKKEEEILSKLDHVSSFDKRTMSSYFQSIREFSLIPKDDLPGSVWSRYARCAGNAESAMLGITKKSKQEIKHFLTEMLIREITLRVILEAAEKTNWT